MNEIQVLSKILQLTETLSHKTTLTFSSNLQEQEEQFFALERLNLPHSGRKILVVLQEKGEINQRTLAHEVGVSPQAASESIKKLELSGCVKKVNGIQKNEKLISLTELGEEMAHLLHLVIVLHAKQLFHKFSSDEVGQLGTLLDKLLLDMAQPPK